MHPQEASGRAHFVKRKILPTDTSREHVNALRHSKLDLALNADEGSSSRPIGLKSLTDLWVCWRNKRNPNRFWHGALEVYQWCFFCAYIYLGCYNQHRAAEVSTDHWPTEEINAYTSLMNAAFNPCLSTQQKPLHKGTLQPAALSEAKPSRRWRCTPAHLISPLLLPLGSCT